MSKESHPTQILPGIIQVTGSLDSGKTSFALESGAAPAKIGFADADIKGTGTVQQMHADKIELGAHINLMDEWKDFKHDWERYLHVKELINSIDYGVFDVFIFDDWQPIAKACRAYVAEHPKEFKKKWTGTAPMIQGQYSTYGRRLEKQLLTELQTKVMQVIITTHLTDDWSRGIRTGKQIPDNTKALDVICTLRIWLRQNPNGTGVPIGLVLKRLNKKALVKGRVRTINILPRKLTPTLDEDSLWDTIYRYFADPMGNRLPTIDETPDSFELSILDGTLTEEQKLALTAGTASEELAALQAHLEEKEEEEPDPQVIEACRLRDEEGLKTPQIAKAMGITVPEAMKLLN